MPFDVVVLWYPRIHASISMGRPALRPAAGDVPLLTDQLFHGRQTTALEQGLLHQILETEKTALHPPAEHAQYGLDLTGWTLTSATGISADGLTIVGNGVHAGFGNSEGWVACLADFDPDDVRVAVETIFDPAKARCNTDCNRDDAVSAADVSCVIRLLGH